MHCAGVILSCTTAANYPIVVCTFEMKLLNKPFSSRYSFYFLHLLRSREKNKKIKKKTSKSASKSLNRAKTTNHINPKNRGFPVAGGD